MAILYGDGINDDYYAIQELLDSGVSEITLPIPKKNYLISKTLKLHSHQALVLPRYATIRMADNSNCYMLENADTENANHDFSVCGGIWDYNNVCQKENPIQVRHPELPLYTGYMFHFYNVKNFRIADLTFKDPINFCVTLDRASYFTVENITFDFNKGNPSAVNMDGIHLDGNCHYGVIRNLKGACYDDLVALNSNEGSNGPITHIEIDGIFSENCHSAVRLLTTENTVKHIHIHNVHGSFYQYGIGITCIRGKMTGVYEDLLFENLHISKAFRYSYYMKDGSFEYPLIWFEWGCIVKNATVKHVYREETVSAVSLIEVGGSAQIDHLVLYDINQTSPDNLNPLMFVNNGTIEDLKKERFICNNLLM